MQTASIRSPELASNAESCRVWFAMPPEGGGIGPTKPIDTIRLLFVSLLGDAIVDQMSVER